MPERDNPPGGNWRVMDSGALGRRPPSACQCSTRARSAAGSTAITWEQLTALAALDKVLFQSVMQDLHHRGLREGLGYPAIVAVNLGGAGGEEVVFLATVLAMPTAEAIALEVAEEKRQAEELRRLIHRNRATRLHLAVRGLLPRGA